MKKTLIIVRWTARIWGSAGLAFLLFFLLAHLFGTEETGRMGFTSAIEVIMFLFFPIGTILGLAIALIREGLGGLITVGSLLCLFILRPDLISNPLMIFLCAVPGLVYLLYWYLSRWKQDKIASSDV